MADELNPAPAGLSKGASTPQAPRPDLLEQRKHVRFQIDEAPTSFSIKGVSISLGLGKVHRGRAAINLSEGGAMLLLCEPLPPGTKIVVRIEMEDMPQFIETSGVVRWCEKEGRNEKDFHAGIEFEPLDKAQLRMIEKMRDLLSSPELQKRRATRRRADPPAIEGGSTPGG
jgi:hypothetical protein